jgi:copper chaperone CopZ
MNDHPTPESVTAVIEVSGVNWASEKAVAETVLSRRPGVLAVEVNPVAQTATVTYDPDRTSVVELSEWVRDCGFHCARAVRSAAYLRSTRRASCHACGGPGVRACTLRLALMRRLTSMPGT